MKIKAILILVILFGILFSFAQTSFAQTVCQPIYGGGQTCVTVGNVLVNKKVKNPQTNTYVDNLGINDAKYTTGSVVNFQINVTNVGNSNISKVDLKDTLPQYVDFVSGSGSFDANTKVLSFSLDNLTPNETRTFDVSGKIVATNLLPINQGFICVINQVNATTTDGASSQDNSQFCITNDVAGATTKGGFPVLPVTKVTTTPATGAESLVLFSFIPTGLAGWLLRKISYK